MWYQRRGDRQTMRRSVIEVCSATSEVDGEEPSTPAETYPCWYNNMEINSYFDCTIIAYYRHFKRSNSGLFHRVYAQGVVEELVLNHTNGIACMPCIFALIVVGMCLMLSTVFTFFDKNTDHAYEGKRRGKKAEYVV
mmetsp:Transcript_5762/g.13531  ORF Transcript_5762/g.13531 Transcript_5762/m.13531 type:complete len:137 (-) Transcript_5762:892-1302(-)